MVLIFAAHHLPFRIFSRCPPVLGGTKPGGIGTFEPNSDQSQLSKTIGRALDRVLQGIGGGDICAMEVGTATGDGTTVRFVEALAELCARSGRSWKLTSYEAVVSFFEKAEKRWTGQQGLTLINELVMSERNLQNYVLPSIEGPDGGSECCSRQHYEEKYSKTKLLIQQQVMGAWMTTLPECRPQLVLIDSTRFAQVGILATILMANVTDAATGFLIENDSWSAGQRDELKILARYWDLHVEFEETPHGEAWPWALIFIKKWRT